MEKDDFLPREALENRRDVNPVAFSKKALAPPAQQFERKKIFHAMAVEPTTKYQKKEINEADFCFFPTITFAEFFIK